MGYEDAAATKILATKCACCGRPLVDSKSVETGVGPICRKKYGYSAEVPENVRSLANKIIHRLACDVSQGTVNGATMEAVEQLQALGFDKIAMIFKYRAVQISIAVDEDGARYLLRAPYDETGSFNYDSWTRTRVGVKVPAAFAPTKRKVFHWSYAKDEYARKRIFDALVKHYEGQMALAPDGTVFKIQPLKTAAQKAEEATQKAA